MFWFRNFETLFYDVNLKKENGKVGEWMKMEKSFSDLYLKIIFDSLKARERDKCKSENDL